MQSSPDQSHALGKGQKQEKAEDNAKNRIGMQPGQGAGTEFNKGRLIWTGSRTLRRAALKMEILCALEQMRLDDITPWPFDNPVKPRERARADISFPDRRRRRTLLCSRLILEKESQGMLGGEAERM
eukprot:GFKZ01000759.1.p2 GENE.GFKZ01000759.1~~GFKZ01000759.1.p2  ORF type:complete len:127 (-),score=16.75 GFKZ01000759.1:1249-1629(-)